MAGVAGFEPTNDGVRGIDFDKNKQNYTQDKSRKNGAVLNKNQSKTAQNTTFSQLLSFAFLSLKNAQLPNCFPIRQ